jgi:hypothetical protein
MTEQRFDLIYDTEVLDHLRVIEREYHSLIRRTIEAQLQFEPEVRTRNRKPLQRSTVFGTRWELRFGPNNRFWVFYQVNHEGREIYILVIGVKKGERLYIGGKEVKL